MPSYCCPHPFVSFVLSQINSLPLLTAPRPAPPHAEKPTRSARKASDEGCAYLPDMGQCGGPNEGQEREQQQHWAPGQAPERKRHRGTPPGPFSRRLSSCSCLCGNRLPAYESDLKASACRMPATPAQPLPAAGGLGQGSSRERGICARADTQMLLSPGGGRLGCSLGLYTPLYARACARSREWERKNGGARVCEPRQRRRSSVWACLRLWA